MKIVSFDIESSNLDADFGYCICFAYKELGKPSKVLRISDYELHNTEPWNDSELVADAARILNDADVVISYYGKEFDWKFLNGRLAFNGQPLLLERGHTHVDLYFQVRRLIKYSSRSMANVAEQLQSVHQKMGVKRATWVRASTGHLPSIRILANRCKSDTEVLEDAYVRMRGNIRMHPNVGLDDLSTCRYCGGEKLQRRGYQLTTAARKARVQCMDCGAWDLRRIKTTESPNVNKTKAA